VGRRGPPPKPTRMRLLEGNRGKRRINEYEPQPEKAAPPCPRWLTPEARKVWKRVAALLRKMRLLTVAEEDALVAYAQTFARWKAAEEFLARHGDVYPIRDDQGRVKCMAQFPQVAIARHLLAVLKSYQQEFGFTPSARTRLSVEPAGEHHNAAWIPEDQLREARQASKRYEARERRRERKERKERGDLD